MAASRLTNVMTVSRGVTFSDNKMQIFMDMMKQDTLTDFAVHVNKDKIRCHRMVLSASSPFFRGLLSHNSRETECNEVKLDTFHVKAVRDLMEYFYVGELEVPMNLVIEYFEAAHFLQLEELYDTFDKFISANVAADNCVGLLQYADRFSLHVTKKTAEKTVLSELLKVSKMSEFQELKYQEVSDIISKCVAIGQNGDVLLQSAINWIMFKEERTHHMNDFLDVVNLNTCSRHYLKEILLKYERKLLAQDVYDKIKKAAMSLHDTSEEKNVDRKIVVYGGMKKDNSLVNKCWTVDLVSGDCEEILQHPVRYDSAICITDYGLLVAGGGTQNNASTATNHCDVLNLSTLTWTSYPDTLSKMFGATAVYVDDRTFVLGGWCNRENIIESLNMKRRKWKKCRDMLQKSCLPIAAVVNKFILVLYNTARANSSFRRGNEISLQCYDISSDVWSFKAALPNTITKTYGASAVSVDQKMFVIGGWEKLCLSYDLPSNNWTILSPPEHMHVYGSSLYTDKKIIVCGGNHDLKNTDTIEIFDYQRGEWRMSKAELPVPVALMFCCVMK